MFGKSACQIDAVLTQVLDDTILQRGELQPHQNVSDQADKSLAAAQAAWIGHKVSCILCCGQITSNFSNAVRSVAPRA